MLRLIYSLLLVFVPAMTWAEDMSYEEWLEVRSANLQANSAKIPSLVEGYGSALGCAFGMYPENVVPYQGDSRLAVFAVDLGCSGGNQMQRSVFVVLTPGAYDDFYIDLKYSKPEQTSGFSKDITRLYIQGDAIRYEANRLNPKVDALCCPSQKETGQVIFKEGVWVNVPDGPKIGE